jgi:hypothetical protein
LQRCRPLRRRHLCGRVNEQRVLLPAVLCQQLQEAQEACAQGRG